jgi:ribosome-associated protein
MDFGDVIVHIFQQQVREFYDLEGLWSDAPRIELPEAEEASETEP